MLKTTRVELYPDSGHLSEIYQSTGFKFAFLSSPEDGLKMCHPWIKCRDFLNDAMRNQITGKKDQIFGFSYVPGSNPTIDTKRMRMLVKRDAAKGEENVLANTHEMMLDAFNLLRFFERREKMKPITKLEAVEGHEGLYVFTSSSEWILSPFMISLYTFLIRLGAKKIKFKTGEELEAELKKIADMPEQYGDHDIQYLKIVYPHLSKILHRRAVLGYQKPDGKTLFETASIDTFHNYTGIVALCKPANIAELKQLSAAVMKEEEMAAAERS